MGKKRQGWEDDSPKVNSNLTVGPHLDFLKSHTAQNREIMVDMKKVPWALKR